MNSVICKTSLTIISLLAGLLNVYAKAPSDYFTDDSLELVITQNGTYFMPGQEFEMSIFSRCESNYQVIGVSIVGKKQRWKKGHALSYKFLTALPGYHEIPVQVSFKNSKGAVKRKTYTVNYTVGLAAFSISLDRMNVLYIGVDNPISVATSLGGDDKIMISIQGAGGTIVKTGQGKWNVRVAKPTDDCIVSLYVDGKIIGKSQFRVRQIPIPIGTIGGNTSGDSISSGAFAAQQGVGASLYHFAIDVTYDVSGYTLNIHTEKGEIKSVINQGAFFSSEAKQLIKEYLKPGSIVTIGNLFAKGPDGRMIKLMPLVYHIK